MAHLINGPTREGIRRNYAGGALSCNQLLDLLEFKVQYRCLRARNVLANILANYRHRNLRAHNENSRDRTRHYTIYASGHRGIHLRLDANRTIFRIETEDGKRDLGTVAPWIPPGA